VNDRLAFVDCETLGLDPLIHPVWELAVITGGEEHHWFVRVDDIDREFADPVALDLNGFADRYDPDVAVPDYKLVPELAELLDGKAIVGANPHFDVTRLASWFARVGRDVPWHYRPVCIESVLYGVNLGFVLAGRNGSRFDVPWRALDLYSEVTGVAQPDGDRHTALGDARYVQALWTWAHS
jgi:DNA polymerase III epsilon subunit-like protein